MSKSSKSVSVVLVILMLLCRNVHGWRDHPPTPIKLSMNPLTGRCPPLNAPPPRME